MGRVEGGASLGPKWDEWNGVHHLVLGWDEWIDRGTSFSPRMGRVDRDTEKIPLWLGGDMFYL